MTQISRTLLSLLFAGGIALGAAACSGSDADKCEKAVDKVFSLMAEEFGDDADFAEQMAEQKGEAVEECKAELENNPDKVRKALDCAIGASSLEDLSECPEF